MTNRDLANLTRLEAASEDLTTEERQSIAAVLASVIRRRFCNPQCAGLCSLAAFVVKRPRCPVRHGEINP